MTIARRTLVTVGVVVSLAAEAAAWPAALMQSLGRDARRLVPRSLAGLMAEREPQIIAEAQRFPPELAQALATDLAEGVLRPATVAALEGRASEAVELFGEQRVSEGVIKLGALLRIPADLSDPVLSAGNEGYPSGVVREYYAFVEGSLDKIPVVLDDAAALRLRSRALPAYWQSLLGRSRSQSAVIRTELFQNGRVVDHRTIDYRSPVFGVGSLSYSRAVTAIAATWLALWREANGDLTRIPATREVRPQEPPAASATPSPVSPSPVSPRSGGHQ
ncbi:MAG: hypothetical protein DMF82_09980 [Acidobacteria bacterium]|nr:MAG: hypothetical protein DMF82_09980 [Acidobacteriota bacterium]